MPCCNFIIINSLLNSEISPFLVRSSISRLFSLMNLYWPSMTPSISYLFATPSISSLIAWMISFFIYTMNSENFPPLSSSVPTNWASRRLSTFVDSLARFSCSTPEQAAPWDEAILGILPALVNDCSRDALSSRKALEMSSLMSYPLEFLKWMPADIFLRRSSKAMKSFIFRSYDIFNFF